MAEHKEIVERAERTVSRMLCEGDQHAAAAIRELLEELVEETEAADSWRKLALQFDNHRMQALGHLKAILHPDSSVDEYKTAELFLKAPPLDGEEVLAQRIAELAATPEVDAGNPVSESDVPVGLPEPAAWLATFRPKGLLSSHSVAGVNLEELKRTVPSDSEIKPLYTHLTPTAVDMEIPISTSATVSDEQIKAVFLANGFTIKEGMTDLKPYVYQAARALLATVGAGGAEPLRKPVEDGWLQDGPLLYRLTDKRRPRNRDEIIVTMANSSRTEEARTRRAGELLDAVRATAPQANQADALDAARYRFLRDTCWSSDKELATVISLQMNKVWDEKIDEAMARNKRSN